MQDELSELLGRKVDLNTPACLSPYFRKEVLDEAEMLYGAAWSNGVCAPHAQPPVFIFYISKFGMKMIGSVGVLTMISYRLVTSVH